MGPNTCKLYRSVIIASLTILPVIALATAVASNTSEHKHVKKNAKNDKDSKESKDQKSEEKKQ